MWWRVLMAHPGRRASDAMMLPMLNGDTPWWARIGLIVLFWLGPAAIVAAIFLAMWTGWLPSPITRNSEALARIEQKLDGAVARMMDEVRSSHLTDEYMMRIALQTCRNVARSDMDRARCDDYWRK